MTIRATPAPITVERIAAKQWNQLRSVRLDALQFEQYAFGTGRADDLGLSPADWRDSLTRNVWLRASAPDRPVCGIVAFLPTDTEPDGAPQLGAMWVVPDLRGLGLGRRLCHAVADRARADGASTLGLWVVDGNDAATRMYEHLGFRRSGDRKPAPRDANITMHRLLLPL